VFVSHEYFDYRTWRVFPRSPTFEAFVELTISQWRASGGEPDIGLDIPSWLDALGFEIESMTPIVCAITPRDAMWRWPGSFMEVGLQRFVDIGAIDAQRASEMERELHVVLNDQAVRMITPGVLEVIARKPGSHR